MVEVDFGANFKNARMKSRISQTVAADFFGVVPSFLSQLEHNKKRPNVDLIFKASQLYDVNPGYFFTNQNGLAEIYIPENQKTIINVEDLLKEDIQQKYSIRFDDKDITNVDIKSMIAFLKVLKSLDEK